MDKSHHFSLRVYIEDTDAGGIVYYANYLKFAERARTEFLRSIGIDHGQMIKQEEKMFVVRSCYLNCLASSHLDDVLEIKTYLKKLGGARLEIFQAIMRENQQIATLEVVLACVDSTGKPLRIDANLARQLRTHFGEM